MEDTITLIQSRITKKYEDQHEKLGSVHATNKSWLESTVTDVMKKHGLKSSREVPIKTIQAQKLAEPAEEVADKENTGGNQRGDTTILSVPATLVTIDTVDSATTEPKLEIT